MIDLRSPVHGRYTDGVQTDSAATAVELTRHRSDEEKGEVTLMSEPTEPDAAATPTQMEELRQLALAAGETVPDELPAAEAAQRLTELRALADPGGTPEPTG